MRKFQLLATILALGGIAWGLLGLYFIVYGESVSAVMLFAPGYLVTIGYIWRACWLPSVQWRKVIWGFSVIVQGAWLVFDLTTFHLDFRSVLYFLPVVWWLFACSGSLWGLVADAADSHSSSVGGGDGSKVEMSMPASANSTTQPREQDSVGIISATDLGTLASTQENHLCRKRW